MKKRYLLAALCLFSLAPLPAQSLYFPPLSGANWETVSPAALGWRQDKLDELIDFLGDQDSKAFIVLKDGRIAVEHYFGSFTRDSLWYWASAGKTLTATLTGIAQEENLLRITDSSSKYLGRGWTNCPPDKEALITIRHQLTMSSGLDDRVPDLYCTLDTCLRYLADAGTRWSYHNAPYTLLDQVIETASGQNFGQYFNAKIRNRIGMNGLWFRSGYNNVYASNARSMARFGLLMLNRGKWGNTPILSDTAYFRQMTSTSQAMNQSYGYLWWLNGKSSHMLPQLPFVIPGSMAPAAPADMFSALGRDGQILNVVPSQGIVMLRMGREAGGASAIASVLNNQIWQYFSQVTAPATALEPQAEQPFGLYPNPGTSELRIGGALPAEPLQLRVFAADGACCLEGQGTLLHTEKLPAGLYLVEIRQGQRFSRLKWMKL